MRSFNQLRLHQLKFIRGFEGEEESESEEQTEETEETEDEEGESNSEDDLAAIKAALRKERKLRRDFEKKSKRYEKESKDASDQEASELAKATKRGDQAEARVDKLAQRLSTQAVDMVIASTANKLKFLDIDDATKLVDRDMIDVDQDDDDPSEISVDKESVEEALKKLAKEKPHLITAHGTIETTGGKFGGSRNSRQQDDTKAQQEADLKRYPALRNFRP